MATVNVYLTFNGNCKEAFEFYQSVFGGEFMSSVQAHHIKLWFAGTNKNWPLAYFEIKEIMELVDDIQKFETDREETKLIVIIKPALNSKIFHYLRTNTRHLLLLVTSAMQQLNSNLIR